MPVYGEFDRLKNSIKQDFNGQKIQKQMTGFFIYVKIKFSSKEWWILRQKGARASKLQIKRGCQNPRSLKERAQTVQGGFL